MISMNIHVINKWHCARGVKLKTLREKNNSADNSAEHSNEVLGRWHLHTQVTLCLRSLSFVQSTLRCN